MSNGRWRLAATVGAVGLAGATLMAAPARASLRIEKQLALAPGGRLVVKADIGSVIVRGDAASGASVVLTSDRDDLEKDYRLTFEAAPGEARVLVERRDREWSLFDGLRHWRGRVEITVSVPHATSASVHAAGGRVEVSGLAGDADLHSSGGAVVAHDLAGKVGAHSSGGRIEVRDLRGSADLSSSGGGVFASSVQGPVEARSSGGGVHLERVSGDIHAGSSGGGVTIAEAAGRVEASSSGGPVRVRFAPGNARGGDIESSGGAVEVHVDPAVGLELRAATSGGSLECELPVTVQGKLSRHSLHGTLKSGGQLLHLRSSGGGIRIEPL